MSLAGQAPEIAANPVVPAPRATAAVRPADAGRTADESTAEPVVKMGAGEEETESAFRAEAKARGEPLAVLRAETTVPPVDSGPLPPLEPLVQRIPAEVRETLEELFRAKFVGVRRVSARALKT